MEQLLINNSEFLPVVVDYLNKNKTAKISLRGYSMRPFLEHERDIALLTKAHEPVLHEPVLALLPNNIWVLHRIIAIDGDNITLLGDGNLTPEHCTRADIKASVVGFYRKGRTTLDAITSRKWRVYSFFWIRLRPIRRYLLYIYRKVFV